MIKTGFFVFLWIWPEPVRGSEREENFQKTSLKARKNSLRFGSHLFYFSNLFPVLFDRFTIFTPCIHRVQRSFVWINKLLNQSLTLKNVYTCRLARLISPMGSLWIYCKRFLRFLSDPDRLCCSPFWTSITASHSLAGARHVARRATEARSAE